MVSRSEFDGRPTYGRPAVTAVRASYSFPHCIRKPRPPIHRKSEHQCIHFLSARPRGDGAFRRSPAWCCDEQQSGASPPNPFLPMSRYAMGLRRRISANQPGAAAQSIRSLEFRISKTSPLLPFFMHVQLRKFRTEHFARPCPFPDKGPSRAPGQIVARRQSSDQTIVEQQGKSNDSPGIDASVNPVIYGARHRRKRRPPMPARESALA